MKLKFTSNQKAPLYLIIGVTIIGIPIIALIVLAAGEKIGVSGVVFLAVLSLPCIIMVVKFGFLFKTVLLDDIGIKIINKRGKIKRELLWSDVRIFTETKNEQNGEKYICLSANPNLPEIRQTFGGVLWTMFYDKKTFVLISSTLTLGYCRINLERFGIELRRVTNPFTGK